MSKKTLLSKLLLLVTVFVLGAGTAWADTYEQLTSIANIDESAKYVLGIDGTGFHYEGTSSWGKTALPSDQTPIKYTLKKASDGNSFTAEATISGTTYYLQIPTSNTFSMATVTGTNTDIIIGTTQIDGTNYAVANKTTTTRHLRINGTSGLRSYAGTTGTMAYFYKVITASAYTVTLGDDSSTLTEATGGAGVTLPTRSDIGDYTFVGWSETNVASETTTAPTIIPAGAYYPIADITLYPVYKMIEGGAAPSAFAVGATGDFAIVSEAQNGKYYALPTKPTVSSGKITAQEITVSEINGVKYITTANGNGFTWTIAAATNGYTLSDGSNYIYHSNGGASGTNLAYGSITYYTWSFIKDGDYVKMTGMNGETTNSRGLLFSGTTIGGYALSNWGSSGYYKTMILPVGTGGTTYYWSSPVAAAVERPVITIAENPFYFSTTATITCDTEGASIKYSYDGTTWSDYSSALTITETTTIYAKAVKGSDESSVATATATKNLAPTVVTVSGDLTLDLDGDTNVSAGTLTAAVTYNDAPVSGATVTWSSSNTEVATIDASGAVTLFTTGDVTFTATYAGDSDYDGALGTKIITVINSKAPGTSANNPYTVAQAKDATPASGTSDYVYIKGIVSDFYNTSIVGDNANYRYYISDDGTTDNKLLVYKGKKNATDNFSSAEDLLIGDEVVIYGCLTMYNNSPEVAAGNYIVELNRKELSSISLSGTYTTTFVEGSAFDHDGVVVTAHYSDNTTEDVTTLATFSDPDMTQVGEQTVTVTYNGKEASYTITITAAPTYTATFNVNGTTTTADFKENAAITFPANPASINGYVFVGWSESEIATPQASANLVTAATMGNQDMTFYAVFALYTPGTSTSVTDVLNNDNTIGKTTTSYGGWTTSNLSAEYSGNSAGSDASIQLRSNSNSGIVTTTSGGKATKVEVVWNNSTIVDRTLDIYGKSSAYNSVSDLYDSSTKGTKIGSIVCGTSTELTIVGDYEYIGLRSNNNAMYLNEIKITWTSGTPDSYSDYCTTVPENVVAITVGASKFTSVYYSDKALVVPTGLTAYTFTVNNNRLEISETIAAGEIIAKDQAVVLYGESSGYRMSVSATDGTKDANNVLRGFDVASTTTGGNVYYRLTTKGGDPSTIGFYWGAANGGAFTVSAHKAYVAVDQQLTFGSGARLADIFKFDETTGIAQIENENLNVEGTVYNLNGQRVNSPKKGLYIMNGKKVMVK